MPVLFCFGLGFTAGVLADRLRHQGWRVRGTSRTAEGCRHLTARGVDAWTFDGTAALPPAALDDVTHVLVSAPPDADGDPVLRCHADDLATLGTLAWVGYLSTTGVYGDHGGAWVDEETPVAPDVPRSRRRAAAERQWLDLAAGGLAVHLFRLAGIYGPGRSAIDTVRAGTARRIVKPGQVFCRIHVEDIVATLCASMARPRAGAVYNVCDDEPAPPQDVIAEACRLLGVAPPPDLPFAEADLSPMARSFYADNRRVRNDRIKAELGVVLRYPTYREGLRSLIA
jgi:nucleoside-diphosphate-sugar epimerase